VQTRPLSSAIHERPRGQQRWPECSPGDQECPQLKTKRRKVQTGQLYEFPVLHFSLVDRSVATEDLTVEYNHEIGFQEIIKSGQSLVTPAWDTTQNVLGVQKAADDGNSDSGVECRLDHLNLDKIIIMII